MDGGNFGDALVALNVGLRVQRAGWNGKGMYVTRQAGYPDGIPINANTARATGLPEGTVCRFLPYLMLYTPHADGGGYTFVPWTVSQADVLANDWRVVS